MKVIQEQKRSLEKNKTWNLVDKKDVKNMKPLTSQWFFKIKPDGKYKARLVVRDCEQKFRSDYEDTYNHVDQRR